MYQGDNLQDPLGSGASLVMTTSSNNDRTWSDLHAIQAALIFLQMRLQLVWKDQVFNFCVVTNHEAILTALSHIKKTETQSEMETEQKLGDIAQYQPQPRHTQPRMEIMLRQEPLHQAALNTANSRILEYEANQPKLAARQQPTISYRLEYLCHGGTIINEKYDEEITHHHNWEIFTKHCCEKFLWSTHTFNSVNWKAFQHWGKNWTSTGGPTFLNMCMNGYQSGRP
jgi:hypothetical protein